MSDINDFLNAPGTLLVPHDLPGAEKIEDFEDDPIMAATACIIAEKTIADPTLNKDNETVFQDCVTAALTMKTAIIRKTIQVIGDSFGQSNPEVVDLTGHSAALCDAVEASTERYILQEGVYEEHDEIYSNLKIARDGTVVCEVDANSIPFADAPYFPVDGIYQIGLEKRQHSDKTIFCRVTEGVPSYAPFNSESLIDSTQNDSEFPIYHVFDADAYREDHVKHYSLVISIYDSTNKSSLLFPCFAEIWIDWKNGKILTMMGLMENRIEDFPQTVDAFKQSQIMLQAKLSMLDAMLGLLVGNGVINADPAVVVSTATPAKQLASSAKKRRAAAGMVHKIALQGLRYNKGRWTGRHLDTNGVAWHCVRGHFRNLTSAQYTNKQGARVWVKPHTRGKKALGEINHIYTKG